MPTRRLPRPALAARAVHRHKRCMPLRPPLALALLACGLLVTAALAAAERPEPRTGVFPFYSFAARHDIWEITPMDQGGRLVQMQLVGSERDEEIARAVLTNGFFAAWGDPIDWDALEKTELEKSVWLNRWYFLPSLARRYYLTGDRSLLEKIMAFVRQWHADNPRPVTGAGRGATSPRNWRDMQVAWRVQNLTWCYFLGLAGFTREEKTELHGLIDEHAQVLMADFGAQPLHENNHQSHGASAMLYAAILFPEIRNAAAIRTRAIAILEHHLAHAFFSDGNSVELCPGYYPFFVSIFRDSTLLCQANNLPPPEGSAERLRQFHDYLVQVMQPDGTMPPINDSSETGARVSTSILAEVIGRPAAVATPGSHRFAASHQAVMRDPHPATPAYVFLDAGAHVAYHWHAGKLGFHLWYWDEPLLLDSGVSNYDDPLRDSWFVQAPAHNTILIDGTGDHAPGQAAGARPRPAGSRIAHWESNLQYDWAVMEHTAFQGRAQPVTWTRHFVLLKGVGCLIVDRLESAGAHDYTWLFHLPPGAPEVDEARGSVFTARADKNLLLQSASLPAPQLRLEPGFINRRSRNLSAPVAAYRMRASDCVQAFALLPVREETLPAVHVQQEVTANGICVRLSTPSACTRIELFWPDSSAQDGYRLRVATVP